MIFGYVVKFFAFVICFIFGAGFFAGAAKSCAEEKWSDFGFNFMLAIIYIGGMMWITGII